MAAQQVQVRVVSVPQVIGVIVAALIAIALMLVLWVFGANTTVIAVGWAVWAMTGQHINSPMLPMVLPIAFSLAEGIEWYWRNSLNSTVVRIITAIKVFDWLTTAGGLFLVGVGAATRVLSVDLLWWHYMAIAVVALPLSRVVTFTPERASVDSIKNIIEAIDNYRKAK